MAANSRTEELLEKILKSQEYIEGSLEEIRGQLASMKAANQATDRTISEIETKVRRIKMNM